MPIIKVEVYNYYFDFSVAYKHVVKITEYTYGGFKLLFENDDEAYFDADLDFSIDNIM